MCACYIAWAVVVVRHWNSFVHSIYIQTFWDYILAPMYIWVHVNTSFRCHSCIRTYPHTYTHTYKISIKLSFCAIYLNEHTYTCMWTYINLYLQPVLCSFFCIHFVDAFVLVRLFYACTYTHTRVVGSHRHRPGKERSTSKYYKTQKKI